MTTLQSQSIELRNDLRQVAVLSEWVDRFADEISLPANRRGELQVALEEVVINVIKHGFGADTNRSLTVTLTANQDFVSAEVIDDAPAYDPLARPAINTDLPLESRAIGGLGVHMVKQLMESVKYDRRAAQNVLTLRCHRAPAAAVSNTAGGAS
jgi:anti-sigma regulatory factor (Ser/Thr protein kinase)